MKTSEHPVDLPSEQEIFARINPELATHGYILGEKIDSRKSDTRIAPGSVYPSEIDPGVTDEETWLYYDQPLLGTFVLNDRTYGYACIEPVSSGRTEDVWLYGSLPKDSALEAKEKVFEDGHKAYCFILSSWLDAPVLVGLWTNDGQVLEYGHYILRKL